MKRSIFTTSLLTISALIAAPHAIADNIANCEIVLMETIEDESGKGHAQIASYRPAADFIASVYSRDSEVINDIDGLKIRALLCSRQDVIITDSDFKILATGVPFVLSQNFDSTDSDLLTYFFQDGHFQYIHKGADLPEKTRGVLTARMEDFNSREDEIAALNAALTAQAGEAASDNTDKEAEAEKTPDDESVNEEAVIDKGIDIVKIESDKTLDAADSKTEPTLKDEADIEPEAEIEIVELETAVEETIPQPSKPDEDNPQKDIPEKDDN